ncbi:MAG: outer membrane lipoprotein-sorting protein [Candidatus Aminicenantia bacterium]
MKRVPLNLIILFFLTSLIVYPQTGREIMEKVVNKETWNDMTAELYLTIIDARGGKREREIKSFMKKYTKDETKMLMYFVKPADVKGTSFLIVEHKDRDDDRYLYIPALRRVKRILSSGKGGSFMASDFSFYDIGKPKLDDFKYNLASEEKVNGIDSYVIECIPSTSELEKDTGYSKIVRWVRKDNFMIIKADYYSREGKKSKTLDVEKIEEIEKVLFTTIMTMKDVVSKRTSRMEFRNIKVNIGLKDSIFSETSLDRVEIEK